MNLVKLLFFTALCLPVLAGAQTVQRAAPQGDKENLDFPTFDRVGVAMVCMDSHGGPSVETLTACSCRVDYIDARMDYAKYEEASTNLRYAGMPGEKGALFRDMERGEELVDELKKIRDEAVKACPIAKVSPDSRE